jgi:signal transduction histidine kinase
MRTGDGGNPVNMPLLIFLSYPSRARLCRLLAGAAVWLYLIGSPAAWGQASDQLPVSTRVLTNIYEIWEMPQERRSESYPIKTEVMIYYFDAEWSIAWGVCQGRPAFLPLADCPTPLKPGQRVAIDGVIVPNRERFDWDKTKVRVLEDAVELKAQPVRNLNGNPVELKGRLLLVEGLIDVLLDGPTHLTFTLLAGDTAAKAYVIKDKDGTLPRFTEGDFVRMKCVYSPQFDRDGNVSDLSLFVPRPADIEVIGSLKTDPRFAGPVTPAEMIRDDTPTNNMIHVNGIVRSHEPGKWVTIWDNTGQVMVQSRQTQPLRFGDRIEAIGNAFDLGVQQGLRNGLYRLASPTNQPASAPASPTLRLAEQVRDLSREEAGRHLTVNLRAIVTWSHPETPFAYVQDASGGIRVVNPKWETRESSKPGMIVTVRGQVAEGDFVPVVTNVVLSRVGYWNQEEGKQVTLEQAMTGVEDGRWVEMRGFVRAVTNVNGLTRLDLSTSSGEFKVLTPASQSFDYLQGSIVRVQGVCSAVANARHQLTGIQILAPEVKYIQVDEPAPDDLFAVPLRSLDSLRRFNMQNALNQRVRTSGTVVLHTPGRYLYVQDGADSVFALSQQQEALRPGDRVEVVGFPGNQGQKFLLREAAYRRVAIGAEPDPVQLPGTHSVSVDLEGLLAKADGILLNKVQKDGEARLLIQSKDSTFEASLGPSATDATQRLRDLELGSRLAVTGVYEVQNDDYGKPRSFVLRLRSWKDVRLLQQPPWWTLARLLWVLLGVIGVSLIALIWGLLISRKNKLLEQAQGDLQVANDRLELRVEERTRELQQQVAAKERARAELAETQESLMLASRQAGMAEVATGVLHNVGNVLNSVNISAGILGEQLQHSRVESVAKTAALLREQQDHLAHFLTEDTRGKTLPDYLEKLAQALVQDKHTMQDELNSLAKNIEHIKIIVAMQQSHAKVGGVLEHVDLKDLAEDAIQINSTAFDRHTIKLIRDYHPTPSVLVDRHKVLQILINLLGNAKHALAGKAGEKIVTVTVASVHGDRVRITVADNGTGIAPENLNGIFSQGFTTRTDGHGFGLHSGANAAKELGGSLTVHSEGTGRGATFILELPATVMP